MRDPNPKHNGNQGYDCLGSSFSSDKKGFRKASSMLHMILAVFWCAVEHAAWVLKWGSHRYTYINPENWYLTWVVWCWLYHSVEPFQWFRELNLWGVSFFDLKLWTKTVFNCGNWTFWGSLGKSEAVFGSYIVWFFFKKKSNIYITIISFYLGLN